MSQPNRAIVPVENVGHLQSPDELAQQIRPMFKDDIKTPEEAMRVAKVAVAYGLDPFMDELVPYQGKPYITVKGLVRIAERFPAYDGIEDDPATKEEREALGAEAGEVIWKAFVYRTDRSRPVKAYGRAGGPGERNNLVSGKNKAGKVFIKPGDMARKRAIHAALRMAFPAQLPGELVDPVTKEQLRALHAIDGERGVDRERRHQEIREVYGVEASNQLTKDQASGYIDSRLVDTETGEIVDAEYVEADDDDAHWNSDAVKQSIQDLAAEMATSPDADFDPEPAEAEPISPDAIGAITDLARSIKLSDDMLRDEIEGMFGKASLSELTINEGRALYLAIQKMRDGK